MDCNYLDRLKKQINESKNIYNIAITKQGEASLYLKFKE